MSRSNMTCSGGAKGAPGMESTPVQKDLTGAGAVNGEPELGVPTVMGAVCSTWRAFGDAQASWGDIMMDRDESGVVTPPITIVKSEISREEFLFRYYIDLTIDPCKYGTDLEMEMAETQAELEEMGKWPEVLSHLIRLEEEKMKVEEERLLSNKMYAEKLAAIEKKRAEHNAKIAAMKEAAAKAFEEDKALVAAKIAARKTATAKNGIACKYFRDNGTPEPARDGWEPGCGYHKEGKCPCIHPDEPGWDAAVAARRAKRAVHHHAPRGAGGFGHGNATSWDNNWRAAGGGKPGWK
jgi:hypothetical protein